MKDEKKRTLYLKVRVSPEEMAAIKKKFENSGMSSLSTFVRAMIFEGYIVHIDENELKRLTVLANNIANNINQIAHRANVTNKVYKEDIEEIKELGDKLWRIIPDGDEIQYVRYELDWLLKLLRTSQKRLQSLRRAGLRKNYGVYCIYNIDLEVHSYVENT